jgi:hypothetical protein
LLQITFKALQIGLKALQIGFKPLQIGPQGATIATEIALATANPNVFNECVDAPVWKQYLQSRFFCNGKERLRPSPG